MSDYDHASSCFFNWTRYQQNAQSNFRLLMKEIVMDKLSDEQVNILHWYLKLPARLLGESCVPMAVLRSLEETQIILEWSRNPSSLISILQTVLNRDDLAVHVSKYSGRTIG